MPGNGGKSSDCMKSVAEIALKALAEVRDAAARGIADGIKPVEYQIAVNGIKDIQRAMADGKHIFIHPSPQRIIEVAEKLGNLFGAKRHYQEILDGVKSDGAYIIIKRAGFSAEWSISDKVGEKCLERIREILIQHIAGLDSQIEGITL